jgi:hypothetical protein
MGVEQVLTGLRTGLTQERFKDPLLNINIPSNGKMNEKLDDMPTGHNTASSTVREHTPEIEAKTGSHWTGSMGESGLNDWC